MVITRDILRIVLTAIETRTPTQTAEEFVIDEAGIDATDLQETMAYCHERSYIELHTSPERFGTSRPQWLIKRLTASGRDKLRSLRGQEPL